MSRYAFANGWRGTLSASMSASGTSLTPSATVGFPTCDPTAADPVVVPVVVETDPGTGQTGPNTEIVKVTDTRTIPWVCDRADESVAFGVAQGAPIAHPAGAAIAAVASAAALAALVNPAFSSLTGVSGWASAADNDVATWSGGVLVPSPPTIPGLAVNIARNASGVSDGHSTVPSSGQLGNSVTVTDGSGNPLSLTIPANIGRSVLFEAVVPMQRDANADSDVSVLLTISETTDHDAALTTLGLNKIQWISDPIPMPPIVNAQFTTRITGCYMDASEFPIDRKFYVFYNIWGPFSGGRVGRWVQNMNTADPVVTPPGAVNRAGSRLIARLV